MATRLSYIVNAIHNTIEDYAIDTDNGEEREDRPCGRHLELSSLLLTFPVHDRTSTL